MSPPSGRVYTFAEKEVFSTLADRYERRRFSRGLWRKMAEAGLFGFLVPTRYGGSGQGPEAFVEAIEAFLLGGRDLGLCLSWLDHILIHTLVIYRFGSEEQRARYLPALVSGERIGALAASEPDTGANPVKMKARAERQDGTYRIDGHKIFITNGPVADSVIVLARTGPGAGKEGISAFLVDTTSPGFRVEQEMDLGFLHTSPHGELLFEGCEVPAGNLLGGLGNGHVRISRAVFAWERFLGIVLLTAHFRLILEQIVRLVEDKGTEPAPATTRSLAAELHITLEALREFSRGLACEVLGRTDLDMRLMKHLLFGTRLLTESWDRLQRLQETVGATSAFPLGILLKDARLLDVNRNLYELQTARVFDALLRKG